MIAVLNTGSVFDSAFYDTINESVTDPAGGQGIDALLLAGLPGQEVGNAIVDVLDGKVNPSGKLTDTWASKYEYYPASATFSSNDGDVQSEEYSEGIYIGYRYFDSFYKALSDEPDTVVTYPFGFGLSYSDFVVTPVQVPGQREAGDGHRPGHQRRPGRGQGGGAGLLLRTAGRPGQALPGARRIREDRPAQARRQPEADHLVRHHRDVLV